MRVLAPLLALALLLGLASAVPAASAAPGVPAPSVKVGDPALLFSLPALNEEAALRAVSRPSVALSDFTGVLAGFPARVVVVHFLQQRGGDGQLQALNRLHKRFGNRGARFVAILSEQGELAAQSQWVESQRLDFPVLRDHHRVVADRYGVKRFPLTVVVNGTGTLDNGDIVALGAASEDLELGLEAVITPYLAQ